MNSAFWAIHESIEKAFWYNLTRKLGSFLLLFAFNVAALAIYLHQKARVAEMLGAASVDRKTIEAVAASLEGGFYLMAAITAVALLSTILQVLYLRWLIVRPLKVVTELFHDIVRGDADLTRRLPLLTHDELRDLADGYNGFAAKLQSMIVDVKTATDSLQQTASELARLAGGISDNAQKQSQDAYTMATQVEIMTYTLDGLASQAESVQQISEDSKQHSLHGGEVIFSAANEMNLVSESVNQSSSIILNLGRESDQISQIVGVIKDIADQTNLLALNAAIEAARAGEHGRGFAVVADEVRKLSERTSNSTTEITAMIEKIQAGTRTAIQAMEAGVTRVGEGTQLAQQAGDAINAIRSGIEQVVDAIEGICRTLKENVASNTENSHKVEGIARLSEENNSAFQEAARTVERVSELARDLGSVVARFRT